MEEKGKVEDIFIVVIITSDTRHNFISHLYSANNYLYPSFFCSLDIARCIKYDYSAADNLGASFARISLQIVLRCAP